MVLKITEKKAEDTSDDNKSESEEDETYAKKRRWDCETILSTLSNHKNHPLEIKEPRIGTGRRRNLKSKMTNLVEDEVIIKFKTLNFEFLNSYWNCLYLLII